MDASSYSPQSNSQSPTRYNKKVLERKLQAQTDWAELSRQQQAMIEQLNQQEKERKMQMRNELSQSLNAMVNQKYTSRKEEANYNKQQDYYESLQRQQEYEQLKAKERNEKSQMKSLLSQEYNRIQMMKEEEKRKKFEQEKQVEQKMVYDALDSLQREKMLQERKRNEFIQAADLQIREKEERKRMEMEKLQYEREEQNRLIAEAKLRGEIQDMNRKMYYLRVNEKQGNLQNIHDQKVRQREVSRDQQINEFIQRGVEEAKRKAEEEEIQKRMKKLEMQKDMAHSIRQKMYENEEQQLKEKLAYRDKVEKLMVENQMMQERQERAQREKATNVNHYKSILENQMREQEELNIKAQLAMPDHERKMQLDNFSTMIPGIKSKSDAFNPITQYARSGRSLNNTEPDAPIPGVASPKMNSSGYLASSPSYRPSYQVDSIRTNDISSTQRAAPADANESLRSPTNTNAPKINYYNPITNPIPQNMQNPYLVREMQRGNYNPRNVLAVAASNNLLATNV